MFPEVLRARLGQRTEMQLVTSPHTSVKLGLATDAMSTSWLRVILFYYPKATLLCHFSLPWKASTPSTPPFSHQMAGGYPWLHAHPHEAAALPRPSRAGTFIHLTHSIYFSLLYEILNSHLCSCPGLMQAQHFLAATLGSAARLMPMGRIHPGTSEAPHLKPPQNGLPARDCTTLLRPTEQGAALPRHSIFRSHLFVSRVFF